MPYGTVAEADVALGHVPAWTALADDDAKLRRLSDAELWLTASYALPDEPTIAQLDRIVQAEQVAARVSLTTPLFPTPGATAQGSVTTLVRKKIEGLEKEERFSTPETVVNASGPVDIAEVDAILGLVGIMRVGAAFVGSGIFVV